MERLRCEDILIIMVLLLVTVSNSGAFFLVLVRQRVKDKIARDREERAQKVTKTH